ncbi:MAG TPA: hypothetical protein VHO84_11195 [Syntrophorhabdaceae bacterium]|nr:hypothetical protein [Syntrophorhabdaceae bacterium]
MNNVTEKIEFVRNFDPDGAARLERLIGKKEGLLDRNIYGERFTDRQFTLVFLPLLESAFNRARILETLSKGDKAIPAIASELDMGKQKVFDCVKELMRKNLVEIANHEDRDAVFRKK